MLKKSPQTSLAKRACRAMTGEGAVKNSVRSAPAQKAFSPAPLRRTTATPGSSRTAPSTS
ncbi:MAG: hypothetical protein A2137_05150 [Chloroflexi bacterium RBG_16_58_8]|nr:MAG: hypothetical protein A2137_05150 [Chloroflexi bacterium RBG_16_58_8]